MRYLTKSITAAVLMAALLVTQTVATFADTRKEPKKARLSEEQQIIHVLNRLGFCARPGDVERVKAMGLENYINQQLNPEKISDTVAENKVRDLGVLTMTTAELYEKYPQPGQLWAQLQAKGLLGADQAEPKKDPANPQQVDPQNEKYREMLREYYQQNGLMQPQRIVAELQASRILRAVYSERQLQEVMVDFWTNHFNVFANKGADRWLLPAYDRDTIRPNALGKFSELLLATAQSPAMLFYLDNFQSVSPNANRPNEQMRPLFNLRPQGQLRPRQQLRLEQREMRSPQRPRPQQQQQRRGINENYARELMELHTLGVDGGYTQKDVQEVARCFTGWTIFQPRGGAAAVNALVLPRDRDRNARLGDAMRRTAGTFFFNARAHDDGEKMV